MERGDLIREGSRGSVSSAEHGVIPENAFSVQAKAPSVVTSPFFSPIPLSLSILPSAQSAAPLKRGLGRIDPTVLALSTLDPVWYRPLFASGFSCRGRGRSQALRLILSPVVGNVRCPVPPAYPPSSAPYTQRSLPCAASHSCDTRVPPHQTGPSDSKGERTRSDLGPKTQGGEN